MTFEELKQEILTRAKVLEICPAYQQALLATNRYELIASAINLVEWCYLSGVVEDTLLSEFADSELNGAGIYTGTVTISNPSGVIFLLNCSATVYLSGTASCTIKAIGGDLALAMEDQAYADVKSFGTADVSINCTDDSLCKFEATQRTTANVTCQDRSVTHMRMVDQTIVTYSGTGNSYGLFRTYNYASLTYSVESPASLKFHQFNYSIVTELEP